MLTPAQIHDQHKQLAENARETFTSVLGENQKREATVGKHEAHNYSQLKQVISETDEKCPKAADTLRWFLWHDVNKADRLAFLSPHFADDKEST